MRPDLLLMATLPPRASFTTTGSTGPCSPSGGVVAVAFSGLAGLALGGWGVCSTRVDGAGVCCAQAVGARVTVNNMKNVSVVLYITLVGRHPSQHLNLLRVSRQQILQGDRVSGIFAHHTPSLFYGAVDIGERGVKSSQQRGIELRALPIHVARKHS